MIDVTQFKIDKKIPIPEKDKKGMRLLESKMEIGDSVLFFSYRHARGLSNRLSEAGYKAATRQVGESEWRVWKKESKA